MRLKNNVRNYTIALAVTSFLGANLFSINVGVQLSLFRLLILLSPIMYVYSKKDIIYLKRSKGYPYFSFLCFWYIYSILLLFVTVRDYGAFGRNMYFFTTGIIAAHFISIYIREEKDYFTVFRLFEWIALFFGVIGVYEMITGNYLFLQQNSLDFYVDDFSLTSTIGVRTPVSCFANPNDYGLFLLLCVCVSDLLSHVKETSKGRLVSFILVFFFIFLIVATQSRAAFISLLIFLFIKLFFYLRTAKRSVRIFWIILFCVLSSSIISWLVANQELYLALVSTDIQSSGGSDYARINLIKEGIRQLANNMFVGLGIGNVEYYLRQVKTLDTNGVVNLHNWWAEVLVSSGIIVFVWYIILYFKRVKSFFRSLCRTKTKCNEYYYHMMGFSFLMMFIVGSVASSSIFTIEWPWTIFPLLFCMKTKLNIKA